jgi:hypothetical protein
MNKGKQQETFCIYADPLEALSSAQPCHCPAQTLFPFARPMMTRKLGALRQVRRG